MEKCGNIKLSENIMGETMSWLKREKKRERKLEEMFTPKDDNVIESEGEVVEQPNNEEKSEIETLNPIRCFGMSEEKAEKWLMCCIKVWHYVMLLMWFSVGAVTFAPVLFITYNVNVLFKNKRKSLMCGIVTYAILLALIIVLIVL